MTTARTKRNPSRTRVALIPEAPAATILTHAAGTTRITATLAGKDPLETKHLIMRGMTAAHPREPNPAEEKAPLEKSGEPSANRNHIIPQIAFDLFGGESRAHVSQREGEAGELVIEGEVMAFDLGSMGRAVEAVMRRVSEYAALSDALLEMRVEREAEPVAASEGAIRSLTRELSGAGFSVRSDVLWRPAPGGDIWLGAEGGPDGLRAFIEESTSWRAL